MKIRIGKRIISNLTKPLIVAEIGINHFGSLKLAKKIVVDDNSTDDSFKIIKKLCKTNKKKNFKVFQKHCLSRSKIKVKI